MKDIHWQALTRFESHDFVRRWYKKAHGRKPNTAKVSQVNACFTQGREYFSNAALAAMSVKPLLLYYGVLSLGRGIVLANNPNRKEESLKPGHGLELIGWQARLQDGIKNVLELEIRARAGTFTELVEVCHNLRTMHVFLGPTDTVGSHGHRLGEIKFVSDGTLLSIDDLISRMPQMVGMYEEVTERASKAFLGCRIANHPPGTHFAFPIRGVPDELLPLAEAEQVTLGSSNQVAPGFGQSDDAEDCLIFSHRNEAEREVAERLFPVTCYKDGSSFMLAILDFPNGDKMIELLKLYMVSYCLGMLCRYYPSAWMALLRNAKGDFAQPLLIRALEAIEVEFPEYALHQLTGYPKLLN